MELADIKVGVEDKYSLETLLVPKTTRQTAAAVRYYSRYNPFITLWEFETVAAQEGYDLPSGATVIIDLLWPAEPALTTSNLGNIAVSMLSRPIRYDLVSEVVQEEIKASAFYSRVLGSFYRQNAQVILVPTPSAAGQDVQCWYGKTHVLSDDASGYDTIPDADFDIVVALVLVEILQQSQIEAATMPDYREGLSAVTRHFQPKNLHALINSLRAGVRGKYGTGMGAVVLG